MTEHDQNADMPAGQDPTAAEAAPPVIEVPVTATTTAAPASPATATLRPARRSPDGTWWLGTGRRKSSVARVRIRAGKGEFQVNNRPLDEFFPGDRERKDVANVLDRTKTAGALDVRVSVNGGGTTGQAGAIVLGLARALREYDGSLEPILRDNNFLTRDPREVERKKYGQPGARARFQFSKR